MRVFAAVRHWQNNAATNVTKISKYECPKPQRSFLNGTSVSVINVWSHIPNVANIHFSYSDTQHFLLLVFTHESLTGTDIYGRVPKLTLSVPLGCHYYRSPVVSSCATSPNMPDIPSVKKKKMQTKAICFWKGLKTPQ